MLKLILKIITFSIMLTSVSLLFLIALLAMLTTGTINLNFNHFGEGWAEVFVWGLFLIPCFIYGKEAMENEAMEYYQRKMEVKNGR